MATIAPPSSASHRMTGAPSIKRILPGLTLCIGVTGAAFALAHIEQWLVGEVWLEALVLAILLGTAIRTAWTPHQRWLPGIDFSAKMLLETAVVLLGASVSAATIIAAGPLLILGIAVVVILAIGASFAIGRSLGLPKRMAMLIACGNSICGNSAIAAVAPVIDADGDDVAAAIAFTAVLGVGVVLGLPLLGIGLHLSGLQYGALAGLTVYAVPQVIAAAAPMGATAIQIGTLVKLVRVLMLGPVCLTLSVLAPRLQDRGQGAVAGDHPESRRPALHQLVPWFILGFLAMAGARSLGLIPHAALAPLASAATLLTVVSMAALGLGVDVRTVAKAGGRVTAVVVLSLLVLGAISLSLIAALHLG
ncbi:YeiH family protein [Sphingobium estronivorans]|uniref:YeiH family protein n=1 Tax=Sphingobium estronivorans TaxID=1577690 RepID=UPI00123BA565|nr:putative sulfate exporter family transporter [Sphingobium estronivorans]